MTFTLRRCGLGLLLLVGGVIAEETIRPATAENKTFDYVGMLRAPLIVGRICPCPSLKEHR